MKVFLIIFSLLINVAFAQSKAGFYVVNGKVITVQDTSSRNYLKAIENAGVVPSVLQNAASNFLVTSEKAIGSYSLITAQYPIMGGTAATHIFNLNKPTGLATDFTLEFNATGWTHSATGAKPDGTTFANTKLNLSTSGLTAGNIHLSYFSGTNETTKVFTLSATNNAGDNQYAIYANFSGNSFSTQGNTSNTDRITVANTRGDGYFLSNRPSTTLHNFYRNGVLLSTSSATLSTTVLPNVPMIIGSLNLTETSNRELKEARYISAGAGFTSTIEINQSKIVTFFNSMQNR